VSLAGQIPGPIPEAIGGLIAVVIPPPGAGFEMVVLSHAGYWVPVAVVRDFNSMSFARLLKDPGSGQLQIPMDGEGSETLFPEGVTSLNANPYFAGGAVTDWAATNGALAASQTHTYDQPWSLRWTPNGSSASGFAAETGAKFATIPGQEYTVPVRAFSVAGWGHVSAGMRWYAPDGTTHISDSVVDAGAVPAATWTALSATVTAPDGAFMAAPLAGSSGSPAAGDVLWFQDITVSYESGAVTLGDYILDYQHLFEVYNDGVHVFDFTGETVTEQLADGSEQRLATIAGPGTGALLKWACSLPPGFPVIVFKTDSIQDGFAEIGNDGNPALDTGIWNLATPLDHIALNPLGTVSLIAKPATTYLGASPYDITSSSISAQVTPMTGPALDGSQLTQFYVRDPANAGNYALIGLSSTAFYCRIGDVVAGVTSVKKMTKYDQGADSLWRISEHGGQFIFWTSADGQNWSERWRHAYQWDATSIDFFFTATYDSDNSSVAQLTSLNAEIITPSSAGNIFLGTPIMGVWRQLFDQAQERGTIPWFSSRMTPNRDSEGNPWTDGMSVQVTNGTDMLALLTNYTGIVNADWVVDPGFVVRAALPVQPAGRGIGTDKSTTVVLREAHTVVSRQRVRARDTVANSIGGENSNGRVVSAQNAASIARYGQREGWVQTAESVNPVAMQIVSDASLDQTKDEVLSETVNVQPAVAGAPKPFVDYDVGDWVGLERTRGGSVIDVVRVIGISPAVAQDGAATWEITISTYRQWLQEQFSYLVSKFGAQFIYSLGTTPVTFTSGGPGTPPTYVSPSMSGLQDVKLG
jgi:hypothetical protein